MAVFAMSPAKPHGRPWAALPTRRPVRAGFRASLGDAESNVTAGRYGIALGHLEGAIAA